MRLITAILICLFLLPFSALLIIYHEAKWMLYRLIDMGRPIDYMISLNKGSVLIEPITDRAKKEIKITAYPAYFLSLRPELILYRYNQNLKGKIK